MPQPVKISDSLIEAAREVASGSHRSVAAQIEHWATLGQAIDNSLTPNQSMSLKNSVREPSPQPYNRSASDNMVQALVDALTRVASPEFSKQVHSVLRQSKGELYGTHPAFPGYIVRSEADGTLTPGRMVNRQFVPVGGSRDTTSPSG
jgi:hypothetical protein